MKITHDRPLSIATGNSRKTKTWKNRTATWSALLDRLSSTTRTAETVAEYKAMSRDRQSDIKDVGGFVGGYCEDGNRTRIRHRSLLCLDADFADDALWSDWCALFDAAAAIYSTHKHTPDKPRLRLVIPLARDVGPDEYEALGRKVADVLGIDKFDDSSYQPQRLMYWPSTSQDGAFVFDHVDAPLLNPDAVLGLYPDWHDASAWPTSSRVPEVVKHAEAKQKDPTQKGGIVGAFCRAYSIREAIAAFVPTYAPTDDPNRYTYTPGTTAGGVVLYDDIFAYSHHATDPASGQLVNAWDLARLHLYGELDADVEPERPAASRPSYQAMAKQAAADPRVAAQLVQDRMQEAAADFSEALPVDPEAGAEDWRGKLKITEKGALAQTIENAVLILQNDPALAGRLALDEMAQDVIVRDDLPWRKVTDSTRQWTDADDAGLRFYLERLYGLTGKDRIYDAVNVAAQTHAFHPVRDYLNACAWDGVPRVESLLVDYLGAEDTPYTRAVTRKTMAAAVARVFRPGCKFDYMLTIRGRQGLGKSALIARLGGPWFSDSFTTLQGKEAYEQVLGVWIMEIGELAGMRKAEAETIKLFISKQSDRFRPAYGRRLQEFPRQCVFIGTTNESAFLRDTTGNRRFWVVDTPNEPRANLWQELTPERVRLIWGEAVEIWRAGEELFLDRELEEVAREVQEEYAEENPRVGLVQAYLDRDLPEDWQTMDLYSRREWLQRTTEAGTVRRRAVCTWEIWAEALGGSPDRMDRYAAKEIRDILSALPEWKRQPRKKFVFPIYGQQRYYTREENAKT